MAGNKRNSQTPPVKAPRKFWHRELSDEEYQLWQVVTRDATPLARRRKPDQAVMPVAAEPATIPDTLPRESSPAASPARDRAPAARAAEKPRPHTPQPAPLTGLDRRTAQRLTRGQIDYEAKLDLHGYNRMEAQEALRFFLSRARSVGMRCVLVVTGKGESPYSRHTLHGAQTWHAPERPGILRSAVPRWLAEAEFRTLVVGFQPAHPRHGGGGAYYILLRRKP